MVVNRNIFTNVTPLSTLGLKTNRWLIKEFSVIVTEDVQQPSLAGMG